MPKVHEFRISDVMYATIVKTKQGCFKITIIGNDEQVYYPTLKAAKDYVLMIGDIVCEYIMQDNAKNMCSL